MRACVIGGGSWGSAFALYLGRLDIPTCLWVRETALYKEMRQSRENRVFLPGFVFPEIVTFTDCLDKAIMGAEVIFVAVPSQYCRRIFGRMRAHLAPGQGLVSLTKGIESASLKTMSEIMEEVFKISPPRPIGVLSGPSFSREVAEQHPTALVLASREHEFFRGIQRRISSLTLRIYTSRDVIGVELAGALKNVIAIASGISDALSFGDNTRAALITRGMAEITRLGIACGAQRETFLGLAGIGDLFLTCTGKLSRNRYVGHELGSGRPLSRILSGLKMVAEGISTTLSARRIARKKRVEMPISEQVYQVLYNNKDPRRALYDLMSRKLKDEF